MNEKFTKLRLTALTAKRNYEIADAALNEAVRNCSHSWGKTIADHIYEPSYTIKGDRPGDPGYGGVDRQFDCYVPAKTEKRWKRTCQLCGKEEYTTRTTQEVTEHPKFD